MCNPSLPESKAADACDIIMMVRMCSFVLPRSKAIHLVFVFIH